MSAPLVAEPSAARPGAAEPGPAVRAVHAVRAVQAARRRRHRRTTGVTIVLAALLAGLSVSALMLGDLRLPVGEVLAALAGSEEAPARFVVIQLRVPRLALGLLVGLAFGLSGALFQAVLRNPLASPDVIGISQGASAAAVAALLLAGVTGVLVSLAALVGGVAVGVLLYLLAWRQGLAGHRFVLCGVGVSYACSSVIGYLLTRSEVQEVQVALLWMTGSTAQATGELVGLLALSLAALVPLVAWVARWLDPLLLGDEPAASLGLRPEAARAAVIAVGVALACVATAAAGPVAFVAFAAAPIARRLVGDGTPALVPSALVGAVLVVGADVVAQHVLPAGMSVPVGVVTGIVGGPYLIWLMAQSRRRTS